MGQPVTTAPHNITIGFTHESFPEGPAAILGGLRGYAFRLRLCQRNYLHDVIVRDVTDRGLLVRTIPPNLDDKRFVQSEFLIEWEDVDALTYH